jgi:hypothetical protein
MSLFEKRDDIARESAKTLLVVISLFVVAILGVSVMIGLSDWHWMSWMWGSK